MNTDGSIATITPFRIPLSVTDRNGNTVQLYPEDLASADHSRTGMVNGLHFAADNKTAQNDGYVLDNEGFRFTSADSEHQANVLQPGNVVTRDGVQATAAPTLAQKQAGELELGHLDCDTIPFLWNYADRFTLFDNFHQTSIGPSTPNAIAMIGGQTGETQWALHPAQGSAGTVPVVSDPGPLAGSNRDTLPNKPPYGPEVDPNRPNGNLTFATLPLSFMGDAVKDITAQDPDPAADLPDIQHDIAEIASRNPRVNWGWYQQGFDAEPFDGSNLAGHTWGAHDSYIVHHNAPQYFGYLGNNGAVRARLHGLADFYNDIKNHALPAQGGVFYVRGGFANNDNLVPTLGSDPHAGASTMAEVKRFPGNDDHPAYSDSMISEALVADTVNAIANSPYWDESAIIITYDETDGLWDHAPVRIRSWDQNGKPLTGGPRIPAIVISPFSAAHTISHQYSEHSSVIRFIDQLFGLVSLAELPDEARGRALGQSEFHQPDLGPADAKVSPMGDLTEAFDNDRLLGSAPELPASYAVIAAADIAHLPHYDRKGCKVLNIVPTDFPNGLDRPESDPAPADFNPRPATAPGIPALGTGTREDALTYPWTP